MAERVKVRRAGRPANGSGRSPGGGGAGCVLFNCRWGARSTDGGRRPRRAQVPVRGEGGRDRPRGGGQRPAAEGERSWLGVAVEAVPGGARWGAAGPAPLGGAPAAVGTGQRSAGGGGGICGAAVSPRRCPSPRQRPPAAPKPRAACLFNYIDG